MAGRKKRRAAKSINPSNVWASIMSICFNIMRLFDSTTRIVFSEGGAMEAFFEARKAGKIRYIGFTGHKDPHVHLYMLDKAREHKFRFDTVQMPLNVMDAHFRSFGANVLPVLVKENIGVLGMKSMGSGVLLKSKVVTPIECLHYALSLPTSVVITGIDSMEILEQAFEAVRTFKPLTRQQVASLLAKTARAAAKGEYELFKTSTHFDSTVQKPGVARRRIRAREGAYGRVES